VCKLDSNHHCQKKKDKKFIKASQSCLNEIPTLIYEIAVFEVLPWVLQGD